ncbi:isocitrate lyase/phosphoenolpyruvate mutase family protein [Caulobacter sp. BE254]|uniref:isocitrate lyase/PEP mutase family protein n=1 Tax=Caulobacter sp. BE254 TaxID=2817720 RepID=UPI0028658F21|nr:isocitrate lyase/phosphoenolpyruvate mutase family protein [Caulobacter sp. BE254]MDR7117145.1 2-methylisocitrate lyase-like PEP mutase family enzyme [Caulobacter sp. BE254]
MTSTADRFHALHAGPEVLVLPNAWDAASAALMEDAGAKAVATSSAAVAWARGYADGDAVPVAAVIDTVAGIARVVSVPVTADVEGGYTDDLATLAETIKAVIGAGAVGINFEDGRRDPDLHARKIQTVRATADQTGVNLFINARTDVYLAGLAAGEAALAETLRRAALYAQAGASGIFVPLPIEEDLLSALAAGIALPLNVMGRTSMPSARRLAQLGVRRLSSATGPFNAAYGAMLAGTRTYLADGDTTGYAAFGKDLPNLNARFG